MSQKINKTIKIVTMGFVFVGTFLILSFILLRFIPFGLNARIFIDNIFLTFQPSLKTIPDQWYPYAYTISTSEVNGKKTYFAYGIINEMVEVPGQLVEQNDAINVILNVKLLGGRNVNLLLTPSTDYVVNYNIYANSETKQFSDIYQATKGLGEINSIVIKNVDENISEYSLLTKKPIFMKYHFDPNLDSVGEIIRVKWDSVGENENYIIPLSVHTLGNYQYFFRNYYKPDLNK